MEEVEENPDTHPLEAVASGAHLQHSLQSQIGVKASLEHLRLGLRGV